jgi:hypothetical protein
MQAIEKWPLCVGYNWRLAAFSQTLPAFSEKAGRFRPETGSQPTGSSATKPLDTAAYFRFFMVAGIVLKSRDRQRRERRSAIGGIRENLCS